MATPMIAAEASKAMTSDLGREGRCITGKLYGKA